jgi:hypothetical protein
VGVGVFMKKLENIPNVVKIGGKYRAVYVKTEVGFVVAGNIKSP